jgi:hypothetical protein
MLNISQIEEDALIKLGCDYLNELGFGQCFLGDINNFSIYKFKETLEAKRRWLVFNDRGKEKWLIKERNEAGNLSKKGDKM